MEQDKLVDRSECGYLNLFNLQLGCGTDFFYEEQVTFAWRGT